MNIRKRNTSSLYDYIIIKQALQVCGSDKSASIW
jgi:hypothetical protein